MTILSSLPMLYKSIIRPILFSFPTEKVHYFSMDSLKSLCRLGLFRGLFRRMFVLDNPSLEKEVFGLKFKNPVGMAAGFDKNAAYYNELSHLGFGFVEVGTVTPVAQDGNPQPRLFRLPKDAGLINRMGFNNGGVEEMVAALKKRKTDIVIGGNIGKNKLTPNEEATSDYLKCFHALFDYVDYFVVNVSSPNTPGLRELQEKAPLTALLRALQAENEAKASRKPILLKIAPDLTNEQLDDIVEILKETKLDGVIAANTTISREGLNESSEKVAAEYAPQPMLRKSLMREPISSKSILALSMRGLVW